MGIFDDDENVKNVGNTISIMRHNVINCKYIQLWQII